MEVIKLANLVLRFILELSALAALGYWGFKTGNGWIAKTIFGIGTPVLAAVVWGLFVSPKATYNVGELAKLAIEIIVFGSAAIALYYSGQTKLCVIFVVAAVVSRTLIFVFKQ
ncbi:YrdB family protein [Paenibacillus radicis (ex Xue et al. 2023)]|uniref:YrdB family protein n=1 Tax=Paenibacillus radicis (ex Xue et al. 2023) TaxID=2972489 RepID=A0ABT1YNB0_9BACL|nr:YrdB family protein [Paenibacillus radicis (ex Xue et al. 2023)]MCR8633480.1 YrdB family protein [Paenibacillus radicis (ex Xue et al. 2023)]